MGYSFLKSHYTQLSIPIPLTSKIMPDSPWFKIADNKREWGVVRGCENSTFLETRKKTSTAGFCMEGTLGRKNPWVLRLCIHQSEVDWSRGQWWWGVGWPKAGGVSTILTMEKMPQSVTHNLPFPSWHIFISTHTSTSILPTGKKMEDTLKNSYTNFLRKSSASRMEGNPGNKVLPILVFGPSLSPD